MPPAGSDKLAEVKTLLVVFSTASEKNGAVGVVMTGFYS